LRDSLKRICIVIVIIAFQLVLLDLLSAYVIFYYFELKGFRSPDVFYSVDGHFPLVSVIKKFYSTVYYKSWPYSRSWPGFAVSTDSICPPQATPPMPFQADPIYGRSFRPGTYVIVFCPTARTPPVKYRWTVTIERDGGRRTAYERSDHPRRVLLLGDSFVFGWGLNDEQTASWLLQSYFANQYTVQNISFGGWGTTEELITVRRFADSLGQDDVVILGYADYYKRRNVAAPSWLRVLTSPAVRAAYEGVGLSVARAHTSHSSVAIDFVPLSCKMADKYCDQPDPSQNVMNATTIALYKEVADRIKSRLAVLYLQGPDEDPVLSFLRKRNIPIIDGRLDQSKYYMDDNIAGYDTHPGPIANYSWFAAMRSFIESREAVR